LVGLGVGGEGVRFEFWFMRVFWEARSFFRGRLRVRSDRD
jgi:hypothetical protein